MPLTELFFAAALAASGNAGAADNPPAPVGYESLFQQVWEGVDRNFYDPSFGGRDWKSIGDRYRRRISDVRDDAGFHRLASQMLAELKVSHLNLNPPTTSSARGADIGVRTMDLGGYRTVIAVSPLSDAWRKGLRPGARLLTPSAEMRGALGSSARIEVEACSGRRESLEVRRERAFWPPPAPGFTWSTIETKPGSRFGYLRIDRFDDGAAGLIDTAMADLAKTDGLVIDLRDNSGGNTSALRLASYLTDGEQPAVALFTQPFLKSLARPVSKADVLGGRKVLGAYTTEEVMKAVAAGDGAAVFYTEDLAGQRYGKPVAVLVGGETGSAAEGFAWIARLKTKARLIGRPTAGALLSGERFDLAGGWVLTVPTSGLWGPDGQDFGDKAVPPHEEVPLTRADLCSGRDRDLEQALTHVGAG